MSEFTFWNNPRFHHVKHPLIEHKLAILRKEQTIRLHQKSGSLKMDFVYLNLIQESHELLSEVRNLLRGSIKLFLPYAPQVIDNENEQ